MVIDPRFAIARIACAFRLSPIRLHRSAIGPGWSLGYHAIRVKTSDLDYSLPPDLIAQQPAAQRDAARLMVVERASGSLRDCIIRDLPTLLRAGDLLVLNESRVVPARLVLRRAQGGRVNGLFVREVGPGSWELLLESRGRLAVGEVLRLERASARAAVVADGLDAPATIRLVERGERGAWRGCVESAEPVGVLLERFGAMPLPPYIRRVANIDDSHDAADRERYQTVYARNAGSVAAPTAGLHLTPELIGALQAAGIGRACLTLHVGLGTFQPVHAEDLNDHRMHAEWFDLPPDVAARHAAARQAGGRIVAVGTTATRVLESCAAPAGGVAARSGWTDLLIQPPYQFRAVDVLLTNFHLPRSTLLALVCAFAGRELVMRAYQEAIERGYRFFSYGDAMLIL